MLTFLWCILCKVCGYDLFEHNGRDSFTLMATFWRKGMLSLGTVNHWDYLELAVFNGQYYVSFPSIPAVVMWVLTFIFGTKTPNTFCVGLYFLMSYCTAYVLVRRWRKTKSACFMSLFLTAGCSFLAFSLTGAVWNQGQLLSFLLSLLFVTGITSPAPSQWAIGLGCLALSVGCRPFQAVYVPLGLAMLWRNIRTRYNQGIWKTLTRMVPFVLFPIAVALVLGWYNWARFGNPIEFGHNYLPEFTRDPDMPQFALKYISLNWQRITRLPTIKDGKLSFPIFNGFFLWLANPMFATVPAMVILKIIKRKWDTFDALSAVCILVHCFSLMMHESFGGWHWGVRYLCDALPVMLLVEVRNTRKQPLWETLLGIFAIVFNIYGSVWFYLQ